MERYDVVVLGTGAAGLTAAIAAHEGGASVAVFEKADQVGGTTAWSGGQVWIPNNPHMAEVGVTDSREQALTYVMSLSRDLLEQRLVEAYIDAGPEMVELLEAKTPVQFYAVAGMPDYHPEFPGGSPGGGRTLECPIFAFDELGEWADRVTPSPYFTDPHITMSETPLGKAVPEPPSAEEHERRLLRNERGCGQALAGRLLQGLPRPRHRAPDVMRRPGADRRGRRGGRRRGRHARWRRLRCGPTRASCWPPAASSGTRSCAGPSSVDR